jgi:tRNA A-37 threonylcarbamoyl transferase component Bud32
LIVEAKVCPQCGKEVPVDAPHGICPTCLLKAGLDDGVSDSSAANKSGSSVRASRFIPPTPDQLADEFPQFEVLELVGHGGMGAVYKVRQRQLDRVVALKILPSEIGEDSTFAERFAREGQTMARLSHPNIVLIFDFGQAGGMPYFVMEFVDGTSLRQTIDSGGLKPDEALAIVSQICDALGYAHEVGIVHRDIKPDNILLDRQGNVKIADFGLARLLLRTPADITLTGTRQVLGTPHYMAPEQMETPEDVDHRADIYALGVVFYEMLTGELPLGRFAPPSRKVDVDVRLDQIVHRALEKEPARRYQQASDIKTAIVGLSTHLEMIVDGAAHHAGWSIRQLWRVGWRELTPFLPWLMKCAAFLFYLFCMCSFFYVDGIAYNPQRYTHHVGYTHNVGAPEPWFRTGYHESYGFRRTEVLVFSGGWFSLIAGIVAYFVYWRMKRSETGSTERFRFPTAHAIVWLFVAVLVIWSAFIPSLHNLVLSVFRLIRM